MPQRIAWMGWHIWATLCGVLGIAAVISASVVLMTAQDGPVLVTMGPPYDITNPVKAGGRLDYRVDVLIRESCPGQVVATFTSLDPDHPQVVTTERAALINTPQAYPGIPISRDLPPAVTPGKWRFKAWRQSTCRTRKRDDLIAAFDITVVP